jgi:hypothetical protein
MKECDKYKSDLINYAIDEAFLTEAGEQNLFTHLRGCRSCRKVFVNKFNKYKGGQLVLTESKQSVFHIELMPDERVLDNAVDIGVAAEVVWNVLGEYGKIELAQIGEKVGLSPDLVNQAIGWLARESKIIRSQTSDIVYVFLVEPERRAYRLTKYQLRRLKE